MKEGIAVAGSAIVDKINEITAYPTEGRLTKILAVKKSVGGCVPNVAIDLKKLCPSLKVSAVCKIGRDENGEYLKKVLLEKGIDTTQLSSSEEQTSFTEVMSVIGNQRTFFTYAGASANFGVNDVDFDALNVKMLHLGYFLLLDKIDLGEGEQLLKRAKERGIKTSIDLVSENSNRYSLVLPCLKHVDNLIINEIEAGKLCDIAPTEQNMQEIAKRLKQMGVLERIIIHAPHFSLCYNGEDFTKLASYELPKSYIKGTTGAGDAFCAGALLGIYQGLSDQEILNMATISAVGALSEIDATSGLKEYKKLVKVCKNFKRREIC